MREKFQVVVIGGGTTGTATVRDLVLRGFKKTLLLERKDLASGTSGGCHSALHGGSRYVVSDIQTAVECLQENRVFRDIVPQVIDPTDAIWVAKTAEQMAFARQWMKNADQIGLPYEIISVEQARAMEPLLAADIQFALRTIDTGFDPFRLCMAQAYDAQQHGAVIRTHSEVIALLQHDRRVIGVRVLDHIQHSVYEVSADLVINAAGPWGGQITEMAGFHIPMKPNKGTMGVYSMRPTSVLIGILRTPADGDGLVSQGYQNTALLGTSSVDIADPDDARPGLDEIKVMEDSVAEIIPDIREARMIRMCTGVRPLYSETSETGRAVSRRMILLDHEKLHGVPGLLTITGGKYATARLMAEAAVDLASEKLAGKVLPCVSAQTLIYGAQSRAAAERDAVDIHNRFGMPLYAAHKLTARYGAIAKTIVERYPADTAVIDDSVQIIGSEVRYALDQEYVQTFDDLRRRIRNGMGQDQGLFSTHQIAALYQDEVQADSDTARAQISDYVQARWKGIYYAALYGDQLPLVAMMQAFYLGLGCFEAFAER